MYKTIKEIIINNKIRIVKEKGKGKGKGNI